MAGRRLFHFTGRPQRRRLRCAVMLVHALLAARAGHRFLAGLFIGIAVLAGGCGGGSAASNPRANDGGVGAGDGADGSMDSETYSYTACPVVQKSLSFAEDVKPFLDTRCTVCHSTHPRDGGFAPGAQNFDTYASFKPWAREALVSLRQRTMPPPESDAPVTVADICLIESWINQGANDN